jgi:hypothetical protein
MRSILIASALRTPPARITVLATLAACSFALAPLACAQDWKTYTYASDGFTITAPATPQMSSSSVPTDAGSFDVHTYSVDLENDAGALVVAVCNYGAAAKDKDPDVILQGAKNGSIANVHATLTSEKQITLNGYKGLEYEADGADAHLSARIYMVGTVLYQLVEVAPLNHPYPSTKRFFDSFQLISH